MVLPANEELALMLSTIRKSGAAVVALGALALGGAAIADAVDNAQRSTDNAPHARPPRPQREALGSEVAAQVKAAALAKVPGATVLRTDAGGPYGSPYHAHIKTSDGAAKVVLVSSSFEATAVQADRGRGRRGPDDHGRCDGRGPRETALTGDTVGITGRLAANRGRRAGSSGPAVRTPGST
jgi:hypothetical protein